MALRTGALKAGAVAATLLAAVSALPPRAAAADDGDAQRAYAAGRWTEARLLWTAQAEAGDPDAQLALASLYDLGQGVARDPATAYQWYERAAKAGLAAAEFNVAVMRDSGDGVARDAAKAALWYARAAAHGNRRAQYNLGQLYAAGEGVPRNPDLAETWFRAAAVELPVAAEKLAALRRAGAVGRDRPRSAADASEPLLAAQPAAPEDGAIVPLLTSAPGQAGTVELVWTAPAQPGPVRFFVQVVDLAAAQPREVFATDLNETAVVAPVEGVPGRYAWRVYTTSPSLGHYAVSEWCRFQVRPAQ